MRNGTGYWQSGAWQQHRGGQDDSSEHTGAAALKAVLFSAEKSVINAAVCRVESGGLGASQLAE